MTFKCVRSCLQSDLTGHDPLQEALAEIDQLREWQRARLETGDLDRIEIASLQKSGIKLCQEVDRLQEAKRHFSALADAKGKENCALRQVLRGALCPGGGDHTTVGACVKAGVCGCDLGAALGTMTNADGSITHIDPKDLSR